MKMKRLIISVVLAVALVIGPASGALATSHTDTVTVTAVPSYVAITNSAAIFGFGVVAENDVLDTTATPFTITNGSTVNIDITIVDDGWIFTSGGSSSWIYPATASVGTDTGYLNFSTTGGAPWTFIDDVTPAALASAVAPGTHPTWDLQLYAPDAFTHGDEQQSIITLSATAST